MFVFELKSMFMLKLIFNVEAQKGFDGTDPVPLVTEGGSVDMAKTLRR
jgi:hypothetical protein